MAQTACPSGRIPWQGIIAALQEDDMPLSQDDLNKIKTLIRDEVAPLKAWLTEDIDEAKPGLQSRVIDIHEGVVNIRKHFKDIA